MITTDITVVGGGCVGLTAALSLSTIGYKVLVIDRASAEQELSEPESRVSAISIASQRVLTNLGAWQHLQSGRIRPYQTMHVWDKESFANIHFDAADISLPQLGHIIENNNIRNALIKAARQDTNIELKFESEITSLHNKPEQVLLTLSDGSPVLSKLLVAADGANSWVKQQLKASTTYSDYDHHAIVANIKTTEPHLGCARQVFLPQGPLALLPMADAHTCSIVWSTAPDHANELLSQNEKNFSHALTAATDSVLGVCELITKRQSFPLTMRYTQQWLQDRVVFIGDAAHTIHPLAGLGMNLGLMDAASLADALTRDEAKRSSGGTQSASQSSPANWAEQAKAVSLEGAGLQKSLRYFERWRKAEAQTYILAMSSLKNLFDGDNPIKKLIRGVGLSLTNMTGPVKRKITKQAVGLDGELPSLAKRTHDYSSI